MASLSWKDIMRNLLDCYNTYFKIECSIKNEEIWSKIWLKVTIISIEVGHVEKPWFCGSPWVLFKTGNPKFPAPCLTHIRNCWSRNHINMLSNNHVMSAQEGESQDHHTMCCGKGKGGASPPASLHSSKQVLGQRFSCGRDEGRCTTQPEYCFQSWLVGLISSGFQSLKLKLKLKPTWVLSQRNSWCWMRGLLLFLLLAHCESPNGDCPPS